MAKRRLINKILVAADGSEISMMAAAYAAELSACTSAEVVILYVMEATDVTQFMSYSISSQEKDLHNELHGTGEDIIAMAKKPFNEAGITVHSKILEGYAAETIISEAKEGNYDLIVMGSCGIGAGLVRRVVFGVGSVAERVIANAPCPVFVMRNKK